MLLLFVTQMTYDESLRENGIFTWLFQVPHAIHGFDTLEQAHELQKLLTF